MGSPVPSMTDANAEAAASRSSGWTRARIPPGWRYREEYPSTPLPRMRSTVVRSMVAICRFTKTVLLSASMTQMPSAALSTMLR